MKKTSLVEMIKNLPSQPGVYQWRDESGQVLYVGKAKNLRRRLQQYGRVRRGRRQKKMRELVRASSSLEFTLCPDETAALLLENKRIQEFRPRFNVAGAFSFMYPRMYCGQVGPDFALGYSTERTAFGIGFGVFRSREATKEAFFSIVELFGYCGHMEKRKAPKYSIHRSFRNLDGRSTRNLSAFLNGCSRKFLEDLTMILLERPAARRDAADVQDHFRILKRFFRNEARPLYQARKKAGYSDEFVPQEERDRLFILAR